MRKRISILSIIITTIAILLFSVASTLIYYNSSLENAQQYLSVYMTMYDDSYTLDQTGADNYSSDMGEARVTFIDTDGTVIADSHSDSTTMENHSDRPEVIDALATGSGYAVRYSDTLDSQLVYYCVQIDSYLVRIAIPTSSVLDIYLTQLPTLCLVLLADILICILLVWLSTSYILQPIQELAQHAVQEENYHTAYKELQPVADQMRKMHYSIRKQLAQLSQEKETITQLQHSKQEFISNVTHEMNTPLTSIKGYAEWLVSGQLTPEQMANNSKIIAEQADRLSNLIKCIIDYNQIDNDDVELYEVNVSKVANTIITTLLPSIKENKITLTTNIATDVTVISRQERVHQVIGNLLRNAIKYNKKSGSIDITITGGENASIVVKDTGIGIAEENLDKVFSRFFTVDKSHGGQNGGFGLGLAVVRKICNIQGWTISVDSQLGRGTTFTVQLSPQTELAKPSNK